MITLHNDFKNYYKKIDFEYGLGLCSSFPGLIHLKKTTIKEIWKDIEGYEGLYQVSNMGRIKSLSRKQSLKERILKPGNGTGGYQIVKLCNGNIKTKRVHRLVGKEFIPNPENKPQINHKWGNKLDNRACALEWCTQIENINHAFKTGLIKTKKPVLQFDKHGKLIDKHESQHIAHLETGIVVQNISAVCTGKAKTAGGYIWKFA